MDKKPLPSSTNKPPRKFKFAPKAPANKEPRLVIPKLEKTENDIDESKANDLLRRLSESSLGKPKYEKKEAKVEIAFGFGGSSSSRSYNRAIKKDQAPDGSAVPRVKKEYVELYDSPNNPMTLPLRKHEAGNPEELDEEEFGDGLRGTVYDETILNSAEELGLLDVNTKDKMLFLRVPPIFPGINGSETCNLESLPAGLIGKMLVYESGAVKLKLGDMLYDVNAGVKCSFAQDAVAINTEAKECCNLGKIETLGVVTPNIESMLNDINDSFKQTHR